MTTKNGLHFKRNKGLDVYTHTWYMINTMLDGMRHEKRIDYGDTINAIMRTPVWKQLLVKEREEIASKIPAMYLDIAKKIYRSNEIKKISNRVKTQKRFRPSYTY